jgi:hypothetical protein
MKNKKITIALTPRVEEMLNHLMEVKGYMSKSAIIYQGIMTIYDKQFPSYVLSPKLSPEETLKKKNEIEDLKEQQVLAKQEAICDLLEGTIKNGECEYYTYSKKQRFQQSEAIENLSQDMVELQYSPSKEVVLKLQKDGKCDYII